MPTMRVTRVESKVPLLAAPLVTIVTPSYNQGEFLEETIRSVLHQDYEPIEYLVLDGGSSDGSVEIIRRYADRLAWWTSEPDEGQAQAVNRGFARSTGAYLGWLCSDDTLLPGAISRLVGALEERLDVDLAYGDVQWTDADSAVVRHGRARDLDLEDLLRGGSLPVFQPASLWRRSLWQAAGPLAEDLAYVLDTAFFLRAACVGTWLRLPETLATYRVHPESKTARVDVRKAEELLRFARWDFEEEALCRHARVRRAAFERRAALMLARSGERGRARRVFARSLLVSPRLSRATAARLFAALAPPWLKRR
jgi:glycosyltransferase involved in cell wall biosynthesis